jgi:hypothetical protein
MRIRDLTDSALAAEISALIENASAGATGAASVATCVSGSGGLGAGFDPNGDWGVYAKPKKQKKPKSSVIKRID